MTKVVRVLAAFALLGLPLTACNNSDLPPATQFSAFQGTITDATTHLPIANATVTVDTVLVATTDAKGDFSIAKVPSGIVDYVITAPGYADVSASANAVPGKPYILSVALQQPTATSP
jgi:hypothetical protein